MSMKTPGPQSTAWLYPENKHLVSGRIDEPVNVNEIYHNLRRQHHLFDVSSFQSTWLRRAAVVISLTGFISAVMLLVVLVVQLNDSMTALNRPLLDLENGGHLVSLLYLLLIAGLLYMMIFMGRLILSLLPYGQNKLQRDFDRLMQDGIVIDDVRVVDIETVWNTALTHNITYRFKKPDGTYQMGTYQTHALLRQQINGLKVLYVDDNLHTLL